MSTPLPKLLGLTSQLSLDLKDEIQSQKHQGVGQGQSGSGENQGEGHGRPRQFCFAEHAWNFVRTSNLLQKLPPENHSWYEISPWEFLEQEGSPLGRTIHLFIQQTFLKYLLCAFLDGSGLALVGFLVPSSQKHETPLYNPLLHRY